MSRRNFRRGRRHALAAWVLRLVGLGGALCSCAGPLSGTGPKVATSPWAGVVQLAEAPPFVGCQLTAGEPALDWQKDRGGSFRLVPVTALSWRSPRGAAPQPLPFEITSPELEVARPAERSFLPAAGGWLVTVDRGEFGAGLYSVQGKPPVVSQVDQSLLESVRAIYAVAGGFVGVAGLCHGVNDGRFTNIYSLSMGSESPRWLLDPLGRVPGCPNLAGASTSGGALWLPVAGTGLVRITLNGVTQVASWPDYLETYQVEVGRWDGKEAYFIDFGRTAARFTASRVEWYAPRACTLVQIGVHNKCQCGGATGR